MSERDLEFLLEKISLSMTSSGCCEDLPLIKLNFEVEIESATKSYTREKTIHSRTFETRV